MMNKAYRLVWNSTLQAWTVASELAKGRKKSSGKVYKRALLLAVGIASGGVYATPAANALPTGESVASGSATFDRTVTNQLTINQSTNKLITNWNSFDIGSAGTVTFVQPGVSSIALNRVTTGNVTEIFGQLSANGQLAIVNPNGITFGAASQVSASSLVASVLDISDSNFNADIFQFNRGTATGTITNKGSLTATAGTVAVLAPDIKNSGSIVATAGHAGLVSADQVLISALTPGITQASTIAGLIQNTGSIQATKVASNGGRIFISGDKSQSSSSVELAGSLQAVDQIIATGKTVKVSNTLATTAASTTLNANDNVLINATLNSAADNALNIVYGADGLNVPNESYQLGRTGKVNLNGNATFSVNGVSYTLVKSLTELQNISDLTGKYVLANDIDATLTSSWNSGAGFNPIGLGSGSFTGIFDGLGHTVNNLFINRPTQTSIGLFSSLNNGLIQNTGITNANISGKWQVGALAGNNLANTSGVKSIINNSYSSGQVHGYASDVVVGQDVGGLVGINSASSGGEAIIKNSYSSAAVTGHADSANYFGIGGLVGSNAAGNEVSTARIISSYATGAVTGTGVNLSNNVGGLAGFNKIFMAGTATIDQSFATGNVSGSSNVGGLVGGNTSALTSGATGTLEISNSYATGTTAGTAHIGALAGRNEKGFSTTATVNIRNSYATGFVGGTTNRGGLVGLNAYATVQTNYWNRESTGRSSLFGQNTGGAGLLVNNVALFNADMTNLASFSNWGNTIDANGGTASIWRIYQGNSAPLLRSILTPTTVSASVTKTYDGTIYTPNQYTTDPAASLLGTALYSGTAAGAKNAGSYTINVSGLYSNQFGYDISYQTGSLTIDKANLVIGTANVTKTYDGTTSALGSAIATAGTQLFGTDSLSGGSFAFSNKNAGTGKTVTVSGVTLNDGNGGNNYDVSYADNTSSTINKANLILTTGNVVKTYDGTISALGSAVATSGTQVFAGDSISGGTFAFTNKHAGSGKTVTTSAVTVNDGNSGNNYNVTYADNTTSTINKASLVISSTDASKAYDGTTAATATAVLNSGALFDTDSLTGGTFTYDTKHAGTGKSVSVSAVTVNDGNSGNNYTVTYADNTNSSISKANLVISSADASKTYDGTTTANGFAVAAAGTQVFSGDNLTGGTFSYDTKHAGSGKTVSVSGVTVNDGNNGDNYIVSYVDNTNSSISKANLVISSADVSKTYDGTTSALGSAVATGGTQLFAGDSISGGTFAFDTKHAGNGKTVTTSSVTVNDGNSGNNYNVTYADNTNSSINKASLVVSTTDVVKTYDGTTDATGTAVAASGTQLFDTDSLSGGSFAYDSKHAGTGKLVSVSGVTVNDGNGGNNYAVTYADNTGSTVNKANLVISSADVSKTYDGTTLASGSAIATAGTQLFDTDSLSGGSFAYDSKHAGTGKTVTTAGVTVNDGNSGNNYNVSYADNTSSTIHKAVLVITSADVNKTYDGTTAAAGSAEATSGTEVFAGDSLTGGTFTFDSKHAGTGKTVSVSAVSVNDGNSGNNYNVIYSDNVNSSIDKANLVISTSDVTKTYDGTTTAAGTAVAASGSQLFDTDSLSGGSFAYDSRHAGTGKTVTVSGVTVNDGNSGNNYNVSYAENTSSTINKAILVITATNAHKVYDGTTDAAASTVITGGTQLFATDSITGGTFSYDNKNAGTGKSVSVAGVTVNDGNSGNNYTVSYQDNTSSAIDKAQLIVQAVADSKVYDGRVWSDARPLLIGRVRGDYVTGLRQEFADKNAGTGKTINVVSGYVLHDGNGGNNYIVTEQSSNAGVITPASLTISAVADSKVYDGFNKSNGKPVVTGIQYGDRVTGLFQQFADRNAGTGKTINVVSGYVVQDGNGGNNYIVSEQSSSAGVITPATLTITAVADNKIYDGNTLSSLNPLVSGLQYTDRVTGLWQDYADRNAGTGKTINIRSGFMLQDGNGGNNYTVNLVSSHSGVITPKQLTIAAVANSKAYDGGITSANKPTVTGLVTGDRVTGLFQQYTDKQIGTSKTLVVKGGYVVDDANGGNNYTVDEQSNQQGIIF